MEMVKISSKGQIVIPKSLRQALRINVGDSFVVTGEGKDLRLRPVPATEATALQLVAGILHKPANSRKLSDSQLQKHRLARLRKADKATKHS